MRKDRKTAPDDRETLRSRSATGLHRPGSGIRKLLGDPPSSGSGAPPPVATHHGSERRKDPFGKAVSEPLVRSVLDHSFLLVRGNQHNLS